MPYAASALATYDNILAALDHLAGKAQDAACNEGILASAKLAEDMFPLETQFRIAINQVLLALGRVWAMDIPLDETAYESFAMVRERLAECRAKVAEAKDRDAVAADSEVDYTLPNAMRFVMTSEEYVRDWMMPNFYFHAATAYGLLRREGLEIGKRDFLPFMMRYARPPEN
jgi:hypothetical protein